MADFPGLPAFAGPVVDATPFPVGDGVLAREATAAQLAAYMATKNGSANLLGRWTGVDTTQFEDDQTLPNPAYGSGVNSPTFAGSGGYLAIGAASLDPNAIGVYWLAGNYALEEIDEIRLFTIMPIPTLGDELRLGLAFGGDSSANTFFALTTGYDAAGAPAYVLGRSDAPGGALIASEAKIGAGNLVVKIRGKKDGGTYPAMNFEWRYSSFGVGNEPVAAVMTSSYIHNAIAPFPSTWNASLCNRVGVVVQSGVGAVNPVTGYIADIEIVRRQT